MKILFFCAALAVLAFSVLTTAKSVRSLERQRLWEWPQQGPQLPSLPLGGGGQRLPGGRGVAGSNSGSFASSFIGDGRGDSNDNGPAPTTPPPLPETTTWNYWQTTPWDYWQTTGWWYNWT